MTASSHIPNHVSYSKTENPKHGIPDCHKSDAPPPPPPPRTHTHILSPSLAASLGVVPPTITSQTVVFCGYVSIERSEYEQFSLKEEKGEPKRMCKSARNQTLNRHDDLGNVECRVYQVQRKGRRRRSYQHYIPGDLLLSTRLQNII